MHRRDNLTAAIHMLVETVFWFHPAVWWIRARLIEERERACDEGVVRLGSEPRVYAESILKVCEFYLAAPVCAAGVTGGELKKRIEGIMENRFGMRMGFGKRVMLAAAGFVAVTVPLALGVLHAGELPRFEVASIKPTTPGPNGLIMNGIQVFPGGRVSISAFSLRALVITAFRFPAWQVSGGDDWTTKNEYTIEAKPSEEMQRSITDLRHTNWTIEDERLCEMLQALLIDRFQLKYHRETKTGDVYLLERSGKTLRLQPTQGTIKGWDMQNLGSWGDIGYAGRWSLYNISMPQVAKLGGDHYLRAPVLDRTGLSGQFDYRQAVEDDPDVRTSFQEMLSDVGLKLERSKGPVETLVIDSAEKPSAN